MTTTIFQHELGNKDTVRVAFVMNRSEVLALADVARVATDANLLYPDLAEQITWDNAANIYKWATDAAAQIAIALAADTPKEGPPNGEE